MHEAQHVELAFNLGSVYTMDCEVRPWKMAFFHGTTSMVRFLEKTILQSLWGPSLGVNQMWTTRNDHAPKNECVDCFNICHKRQF